MRENGPPSSSSSPRHVRLVCIMERRHTPRKRPANGEKPSTEIQEGKNEKKSQSPFALLARVPPLTLFFSFLQHLRHGQRRQRRLLRGPRARYGALESICCRTMKENKKKKNNKSRMRGKIDPPPFFLASAILFLDCLKSVMSQSTGLLQPERVFCLPVASDRPLCSISISAYQYSRSQDLWRALKPDEATYPSPGVALDRIFKYYDEKAREKTQ